MTTHSNLNHPYRLVGSPSAPNMRLVALTGGKGSGKSEVGRILVEQHGFVRMRFADGLKRMLRALGLTEAQIDGAEKEQSCELLGGKSPRWAMQSLGTEWGRQHIHSDLWAMVTRNDIIAQMLHDPDCRIVVDDCRFPNEAHLLHCLGGELWRIHRPGCPPTSPRWPSWLAAAGWLPGHPSEFWWSRLPATEELVNDGSLDDLNRVVATLVGSS
jgi:hypothetical protein